MTTLVYDGTWEGLLSAIFCAFPRKDITIKHPRQLVQSTMFVPVQVEAKQEQVNRVTRGMTRLDRDLPSFTYRGWLAETEGFEDDLLETLRLGFATNTNPLSQLQRPFVHRVSAASMRAGAEAHRFLGLVRFVRAHTDLYLGDIAPDCNILPLIGQHFHDRFGDQRIILRDVRRHYAMISDDAAWWIAELPPGELSPLPRDDSHATMWHAYFRTIAHPERANPKLQQHFVPLKYRQFLSEFDW